MAPTVSSIGTRGSTRCWVVEVDVVDPEPAQRCLTRLPHVGGVAADPGGLAQGVGEAELRGQHHLVAPPGDGPPDAASREGAGLHRAADILAECTALRCRLCALWTVISPA
jgi:hypothetical protein